jgi:hypothetical protein
MAARNHHQASRLAVRSSEASRREIVFSFVSVLLASALIYAATRFVMGLPA